MSEGSLSSLDVHCSPNLRFMGNTYFHVLKCTLGDVPGCIIFPFIPFTGPVDSFLCVSLIKIKNLVCVIVL